MDQPNLYCPGDIVWVTEQSCHGRVEEVNRPIGDALHRYTIETDYGFRMDYIEEDRLYPSSLPTISEEKENARETPTGQTPKGKLLQFPRSRS